MEKKTTNEIMEEIINDDKWDNRELGCDERYVKQATPEEMEKFRKAMGKVSK